MIRRTHSSESGFTLIELLVVMIMYGTLLLIAMPQIQNLRMMNALSSGQQAVTSALLRARWMAINRGEKQFVTLSGSDTLQIRAGSATGTVLASANLSNYSVTVDTFTPFSFDPRGFLDTSQTVTVRQATIGASASVTVGVYGRVVTS